MYDHILIQHQKLLRQVALKIPRHLSVNVTQGVGLAGSKPGRPGSGNAASENHTQGRPRQRGPSVLLIPPGGWDAGIYERLAAGLADGFTVVTYDRRANSRSPRPEGYASTSVPQHADDAAALVEALGLAPAAVFGSSNGAVTLLDLVARRPDVLRGALVHEPAVVGVLANAADVGAQLQAMVEQGFARGGPRAAIELFARTVQGDATYEAIDPAVRERLLGNGEIFFAVEMQPFAAYVPDADALAAAKIPVTPLAGVENRGTFLYDATRWLGDRVGAAIVEIPGRHAGFADHPQAVAAILRPILERLS